MTKAVLNLILFGLKRNPMLLRWFLRELIQACDIQTLSSVTFNIKEK